MSTGGFRGNLRSTRYFEGWYLKHVSSGRDAVYSFIPGVSLNKLDPHAFIQVINGRTGATWYVPYPLEAFRASRKTFDVTIGSSHFSAAGCKIAIDSDQLTCTGSLSYTGITPFPSSVLAPDIMGWYSYVPFMECIHDVVSMTHRVTGTLMVDGARVEFNDGDGYIEKDRGRSFPNSWIWVQCNSFGTPDVSLMVSIARIPWLGRSFAGFLGFVHCEGETVPFATWNGSTIESVQRSRDSLNLSLRNRTHRLELQVAQNRSGSLRAPTGGTMSRRIKESIDSSVTCALYRGTDLVLSDTGTHAGLEVIEEIFGYLTASGVSCSQPSGDNTPR